MGKIGERMTTEEFRALTDKAKAGSKYKNTKVTWTGKWRGKTVTIKFDSIKEMYDGIEAIDREKRGLIRDLEFQKRFVLVPKTKSEAAVNYYIDRFYYDLTPTSYVAADTKGYKTRVYINKRKLFKHLNPDILFLET